MKVKDVKHKVILDDFEYLISRCLQMQMSKLCRSKLVI